MQQLPLGVNIADTGKGRWCNIYSVEWPQVDDPTQMGGGYVNE
jgi:hypothetical protein